ncbi:hypothetical protein CYMTET_42074 [Cymbomonas tetramitiformis]|uniref:Uncharacterized protein n=1 Tax=Cymbomonas tetramitiformis TaxID=36881 RepID=A0AAE0F1D2_9CHLO|nr:hypothetical protein CYMTET_42074 [Cymbomonas tetramitiformis]
MRWLVAYVVLAVSPACEATLGAAPWSWLPPGTGPFTGRALQQTECKTRVAYSCDSTKTKIFGNYYEGDCTGDPVRSQEEEIARIGECVSSGSGVGGTYIFVTCNESLEPMVAQYSDSECASANGDPVNFALLCSESCEQQYNSSSFVKHTCSEGSSDFTGTMYSDPACSEGNKYQEGIGRSAVKGGVIATERASEHCTNG